MVPLNVGATPEIATNVCVYTLIAGTARSIATFVFVYTLLSGATIKIATFVFVSTLIAGAIGNIAVTCALEPTQRYFSYQLINSLNLLLTN